ncbi:MAG: response regulator [Candidatus Lokiarchaeota archaeon]|nr:response regulator [Candidatus Lokiarchaeota archaeon]
MILNDKIKPVEILLVEDNPADVRLTQLAIKKSKLMNNLRIVQDGVEAIELLKQRGKYKDDALPDLILLDLNLPKKNGFEVLKEIKNDDVLKRIPVVILSISNAEEDLLKSYNLHANCYIKKPVDINEFEKVVKSIGHFCFTIVMLPENNDPI